MNPDGLHSCLETTYLSFCSHVMSASQNVKARDEHQLSLLMLSILYYTDIDHIKIKHLNKCGFRGEVEEDRPRRAILQPWLRSPVLPVAAITLRSRKCDDISEGAEGKWHLWESWITIKPWFTWGICFPGDYWGYSGMHSWDIVFREWAEQVIYGTQHLTPERRDIY